MNLFAYCGNNPISRFDNTGRSWTEFSELVIMNAENCGGLFTLSLGVSQLDSPLPGPADLVSVLLISVIFTACVLEAGCEYVSRENDERLAVQQKMTQSEDNKIDSSKVPEKAKEIAEKVKKNNGKAPKGYKGGRRFKNYEKRLPEGPEYREYDVNPYEKGVDRGEERIVIGDDGSVWYTP